MRLIEAMNHGEASLTVDPYRVEVLALGDLIQKHQREFLRLSIYSDGVCVHRTCHEGTMTIGVGECDPDVYAAVESALQGIILPGIEIENSFSNWEPVEEPDEE